VVKVKASQKIFTDTETANLTGICRVPHTPYLRVGS
jgi:hypothetical protein